MLHCKLEHMLNTNITGLPKTCASSRNIIEDDPRIVVEDPGPKLE